MSIALVWFRRDLRLQDNPALMQAVADGHQIIPIYIHAPTEEGQWQVGSASRWWLHHSLTAFAQQWQEKQGQLFCFQGESLSTLQQVIVQTQAVAVYWNRLYEPAMIQRDSQIKQCLKAQGLMVKSFNASLLHEPAQVLNKQESPYRVFTPFWKTSQQLAISLPLSQLETICVPNNFKLETISINKLQLLPKITWDSGFYQTWQVGEVHAQHLLNQWCEQAMMEYATQRDFPANPVSVSHLSPYLHFGELSPRQVFHAILKAQALNPAITTGGNAYLRQLYWREFAHYLLYHFPHTPEKALYSQFDNFPYQENTELLMAWQRGETGYPIIDAGMRELWTTGWMHNRVRMLVASFLTKNLLLPWQTGARWFWDTLVDADLANNTLGWQWVAGCGADAAPYYRIFNPTLQSVKFDPDGQYIRRWLPVLKYLDNQQIHAPTDNGQRIQGYPCPIVDYKTTKAQALSLYETIKKHQSMDIKE
ncbi:deoxyribodipyrimidine photolyase [Beggiatoa alba B18LD]|uniref:Deoxyribodipyrimidine photo-lyase n=1 Tax=Beggiatoa alba B18LD TaxID=395493 RepID=I3CHU2_9GAMM|nr:deoxyribodipyrimidine photo-lyase [Beggiatoa alba]EIJ43185.1 deoxyribodipyrimidine photolyase [Beggiatoa alba B18LD]